MNTNDHECLSANFVDYRELELIRENSRQSVSPDSCSFVFIRVH
jgi:hypothetical protein